MATTIGTLSPGAYTAGDPCHFIEEGSATDQQIRQLIRQSPSRDWHTIDGGLVLCTGDGDFRTVIGLLRFPVDSGTFALLPFDPASHRPRPGFAHVLTFEEPALVQFPLRAGRFNMPGLQCGPLYLVPRCQEEG